MQFPKLPALAVSLAIVAACAVPAVGTGAVSGSITSTNPEALKGATVRVMDRNNVELAIGKTNTDGQYIVSGIPAGDVTIVVNTAQNSETTNTSVIAGRVTSIPVMELTRAATTAVSQQVTGKVLSAGGAPLAGATVTDLTGGQANAQTTTDSNGAFTLAVSGLDKPRSLEISKDNLTTTTTVTADKLTNVVVTLIPNARTVSGTVRDAVFSDNSLADVTVGVSGSSIAATTDGQGNFTLRGVPFDRVTLTATGKDGYSAATLIQDTGRENVTGATLKMTPFGNLVVHFQAESSEYAPKLSTLQNVKIFPGSFAYFDKNRDGQGSNFLNPVAAGDFDPGEWEYDNRLAVRNTIGGTIQIKGTSITQEFTYVPAEVVDVLSLAAVSMGKVYRPNFIQTIVLKGVPGGAHDVSVSMTAHVIQKSVPVVIQPLETVSTDLIVMKRVAANVTVGDVIGKVLGVRDADMSAVRIGFLGNEETIDMTLTAPDPSRPGVRTLKEILDRGVAPDAQGRYRLFNVPTGTRFIVAGVADSQGGYNNAYVPNTTSLLNVVSGLTNQAPDLKLNSR
ncbi:MAG: carboxypeptidase regulatory-like domain-containing protein [Candidatus Sericytochromatia bacterium]|nr:carboxypeptidase regulatory-like domain-containing protein [Candidatus Sericytochromatia bacterium]